MSRVYVSTLYHQMKGISLLRISRSMSLLLCALAPRLGTPGLLCPSESKYSCIRKMRAGEHWMKSYSWFLGFELWLWTLFGSFVRISRALEITMQSVSSPTAMGNQSDTCITAVRTCLICLGRRRNHNVDIIAHLPSRRDALFLRPDALFILVNHTTKQCTGTNEYI
jgi:hypothetical protein